MSDFTLGPLHKMESKPETAWVTKLQRQDRPKPWFQTCYTVFTVCHEERDEIHQRAWETAKSFIIFTTKAE